MSLAEIAPKIIPPWLADMEFCHVDDGSGVTSYCGADGFQNLCSGEYDGEAICPACGYPTCPRCAQLSAIEDQLEEA